MEQAQIMNFSPIVSDASTRLPSSEGWKAELAWAEKKVAQIFKSRQSQGSNRGSCGRKSEILPTVPATPTHCSK